MVCQVEVGKKKTLHFVAYVRSSQKWFRLDDINKGQEKVFLSPKRPEDVELFRKETSQNCVLLAYGCEPNTQKVVGISNKDVFLCYLTTSIQVLMHTQGLLRRIEAEASLTHSGKKSGKKIKIKSASSSGEGDTSRETEKNWSCKTCTFINPAEFLACKICGALKDTTENAHLLSEEQKN